MQPFWPTGSGCARGWLSAFDACWAIHSWSSGRYSPLEVLAERESIYRLLAQTTPENLNKDHNAYTVEPQTRYPNLNTRVVLEFQVRTLYDTDDAAQLEQTTAINAERETLKRTKSRRNLPTSYLFFNLFFNISVRAGIFDADSRCKHANTAESAIHPDTLLAWLKKQLALYDVSVTDMTSSFQSGLALCAIISRYRPDLLDFGALEPGNVAVNNQLAFDILEELGVQSVSTGLEMAQGALPDKLTMMFYLTQVYELFRREIPYVKQAKRVRPTFFHRPFLSLHQIII